MTFIEWLFGKKITYRYPEADPTEPRPLGACVIQPKRKN